MNALDALVAGDWLRWRSDLTPDAPAIIDPRTATAASWRSVFAAVESTATRWRELAPARVAIHDHDPLRVITAFAAGLSLDVPTVVLNMRLTPAERERQWSDLGRPVVSGTSMNPARDPSFSETPHFDITEIVESRNVSLRAVVPDLDAVTHLRASASDTEALGLFTSGTTGRSRCAMLPRRALLASAVASAQVLGERNDDRWLACLPLFHIGGLSIFLRAVVSGTPVVLLERFDEHEFDLALTRFRPTLASLVPTMLIRLLDAAVEPRSLRACLIGGGPSPASMLRRAHAAGWPARPTYGLTETASQVATVRHDTPIGEHRVGPPLPGNTITIDRPDGEGIGEIVVDGPTLMLGYVAPDSHEVVCITPPLKTGDLGRIGPDGDLEVFARRTDLIISGGENVYPAEIEAALADCDAIADVAVVGVDDPHWGQRVAAAIVLREGHELAEAERFVVNSLGGHRRPRLLVAVDALPRNALQKLDRNAVRRLVEAAQATSPT